MKHPTHRYSRLAGALLAGAFAGLAAAQTTDISQTPLASASSLAVLPNMMFILDDSGSMMFDALPDIADPQQGSSERRYWHRVNNCKPRGPTTSSSQSSLNGLLATNCDHVDPPFGAVEFNGMYYNPQFQYRPPINYDGSKFPNQDSSRWSSVTCDPYASGWSCRDWFGIQTSYYDNGSLTANEGSGNQTYNNQYIKEWYGDSDKFDVLNKWPEIVYCNSTGGNVDDLSQCRRNGLTGDVRHTGNPFRYTTARWGRGNTAPSTAPTVPYSGAYPDADAVHEFYRQGGSTTITVNLAYPLSGSTSTVQIIPRTGTGTSATGLDYRSSGTCSSNVCTATVSSDKYSLTYSNGQNGERLDYDGFDLVVGVARQSNVVTVSNSYHHGLNVGDKVNIYTTSGSTWASNAVVTAVLDYRTFRFSMSGGNTTFSGYWRKAEYFNIPKIKRGNPHYYTIEPLEHCKDTALTDCTAATAPSGAYIYPAPVRYCIDAYDANRLDVPTGKDPTNTQLRCRKKYDGEAGYSFPRYGQFRRVDVSPLFATYTGRPLRYDCAARPTCNGTEEMTNFANWFAYYRTRMLMMKASTGYAFSPIDDRYRVGFVTINPGSPVSSSRYLKIDTFTASQKKAWYEILYKQDPGGGTPLPQALSRVGRHFAGRKDGINSGMNDDPVQYSCQQNFALLTTDGYWYGFNGQQIDGSSMGNLDSSSSKTPRPVFDGGSPYNPDPKEYSSSGTLADVALYYYQTDLRPTGSIGALGTDVSENNVPTREDPFAATSATKTPVTQHMVTFGLGMAEGLMDWRPDYESREATGDFDNVRKGAINACVWAAGTCNWPVPGDGRPSNLDDLWHAAVNGRGKFFYARDTRAVQDGLNNALTSLQERNASGAAAATSTPNITPSDRGIFKTSYTTIQWNGEVIAQLIDPNDGSVLPGILWSAKDKLQAQVGTNTDSRAIYIFDDSAPSGLKKFDYAALTATEKAWFDNQCTPLSNMTQCSSLVPTDLAVANSGTALVNFLRGQTEYEATVFRDRKFALGDTVNAVPLYISKPRFAFGDKVALPYLDWKELSSIKNRTPTLYVGANDGMLHAFNANTGDELWAFIPRQVAPNMYKLADSSYASKHQYFVDGSPAFMDVWDGSTWRTIVVGGLNAGGRGYYAVDVTNPNAPRGLWEICDDSSLCSISDANMGYSFGNPIITKRASDDRWVVLVTSGYNNVSPGDGRGYLYVLDAMSGKILEKISTGVGDTTTPSGLGKISGWSDNYVVDNKTPYVYAGDLLGNVWKFDLTKSGGTTVKRLGQALDANNFPQPITTRPELGLVKDTYKVIYIGTGRYLGIKDLTDPATQSPPEKIAYQQSIYAFKDLDTDLGDLRSPSTKLVEQTITELSGGQERTITNNPVDWATRNGWFVDLNPGNKSPGERVNVDPQLALGTLIVSANVPNSGACSIGGDSWIYQFDYTTGSFVSGAPKNVVARKQTGALTVGMVVYQLQKGSLVGQIQRSETSMIKEDINTAPGSSPSRRTSWREITPDLQ